jgi:hypothetical protein
MRILLQEQLTITKGERSQTFNNELVIARMVDRPQDKIIRVFFESCLFPIDLWSGDEYDTVGQWTDTDVINRIKYLYNIQ